MSDTTETLDRPGEPAAMLPLKVFAGLLTRLLQRRTRAPRPRSLLVTVRTPGFREQVLRELAALHAPPALPAQTPPARRIETGARP